MLLRSWRVKLHSGASERLEKFAREKSLPMFKSFEGCLQVYFCRQEDEFVTLTIWQDHAAMDRATSSLLYQSVVALLEVYDLFAAEPATEVFEVYGGMSLPNRVNEA